MFMAFLISKISACSFFASTFLWMMMVRSDLFGGPLSFWGFGFFATVAQVVPSSVCGFRGALGVVVGNVGCVVTGFLVVGAGVFSLPRCLVVPAWGCCLSVVWFLLRVWICCSILIVLCSRRVFCSRIVAFVARIVFMVAAMLAMSVCILCSVSVRLGGVWFIFSNAGCRDCLTCRFPLGVGFSRSSSICEMSESAIEEGMSLSPSLASWLTP